MKMPIKCPVCKDILLNDYRELPSKYTRLTKSCSKRLDHHIEWEALDNSHEYINKITVFLEKNTDIIWYVYSKQIVLNNPRGEIRLPYFDPDLSDMRNIRAKIKTYVVFS